MTRIYVETLAWLAFVVLLWMYAGQYDRPIFGSEISIVDWPRGLMVLVLIAAIFHFFSERARIRARREPTLHRDAGGGDDASEAASSAGAYADNNPGWLLRMALTVFVPFFYIWALPKFGFFVTTPFFVVGFMIVFREYRWRHLIVTSFAFIALMSLLFTKVLYVPLPTGNVSGFYELNTAIAEAIR